MNKVEKKKHLRKKTLKSRQKVEEPVVVAFIKYNDFFEFSLYLNFSLDFSHFFSVGVLFSF